VMDFPKDKNALNINDQYMFGKSLLVSPVTKAMDAKPTKETYLPAGANWFDFWTGEQLQGGNKVTKETPIDIMPLYVKAGSVLPIGPDVQYAQEKKWDELEIRIYPGANGQFVLYEDENDNYNYEKGIYSTITFNWDDKKKTLTIGNRKGSFPGMLEKRKFNVVIVKNGKGVGANSSPSPDAVVNYEGKEMKVKL
jgi:alpha-D-xyloside xylohydrolase